MFKKHMTPLSKNGKLDNRPGKGVLDTAMPSAARGGPANIQTYAKATPMANPQPPAPPDYGSSGPGSIGGI